MALIPIRKPRPFAGKKGQPIKDLYSSAMGALGVISVSKLKTMDARYNTQAVVLYKQPERIGAYPDTRTVVYRRMDLLEVFRQVDKEFQNNYTIETVKELEHPLSTKDILRLLNGQFACDFEEDDLDIVNTCCTEYTLTAKSTSIGYTGKIAICIGRELVFDCTGAPHVTDDFEIVGRVKVTLGGGEVYEGTIEEIAQQMNASTEHGVRIVFPTLHVGSSTPPQ